MDHAAPGARTSQRSVLLRLTTPVEKLPGLRAGEAGALRALGIPTLAHLIYHLPYRHERLEAEAPIASLRAGELSTARGEVTAVRIVNRGRLPRLEAALTDHTARLDLVWFNAAYMRNKIHPGVRLRVQGKTKRLVGNARSVGGLQIANPRTEVLKDEAEPLASGAAIRPVYPAAESITSQRIWEIVQSVLDEAAELIEDHLSDAFRAERELPSLANAYRMIHQPTSMDQVAAAVRRLAYDELLILQLGVQLRREHLRSAFHAPALRWTDAVDRHIRARLPFVLTPGQEEVIRELGADLSKPSPASRLIQGDVGSGKTVVALYAMLLAVASGRQAALMAPTELLARQHHRSIGALLAGSDVRVELLTGGMERSARANLLADISRGDAHIVIGTHALLSQSVEFKSLATAVIDEQHRFGVHQRAMLRERTSDASSMPHVVVMTATPIPRTLGLTLLGDLDISTLRGLPPGRKPVRTRLVGPEKSDEVYDYLRQQVERGAQAFVLVPAVGDIGEDPMLVPAPEPGSAPPDSPRPASVQQTLKRLEEGPLKGLRLGAVHGRLKPETRDRIMERFRSGAIDVLVATTVVEVGVDVPGATVLVVEQAERFGMAQLHQLRGRVGRGARAGVCVLIADPPTPLALSRLNAVVATADGFELAEQDFLLRGPGEVFGARQAGGAPFRVVEFPRDSDLLLLARRDAKHWIERSPQLSMPADTLVRSRLMKSFGKFLGLGDVG